MKNLLDKNDYYQVESASLIADYDYETIINLYQPFIGYAASILYFTFIEELKYQEWIRVSRHETLFNKLHMSRVDFLDARKKLEGIGLLKSYRKENGEDKAMSYIYELYAPKSPNEFFNDVCFRSLLASSVGEKEYNRLLRIYLKKDVKEKHFEISATYKDIYPQVMINNLPDDIKLLSRFTGDVSTGFKMDVFLNQLKDKYSINKNIFTQEDINEIDRISLLFGISEEYMVDLVFACYHADREAKFDKDELFIQARNSIIYPSIRKNNNSDIHLYEENTAFASKINQMNTTAPYEYFRLITNEAYPSPSDIAILNDLSSKYHLPIGVINALVTYTLENNDMAFPRAYCEKIASQLARLKVQNAMEAYNYLYSHKKKKKVKMPLNNDENIEEQVENNEDKENLSSEELKKIVEEW